MPNINWEMAEKKFEDKVNLYKALGYRIVAFDMPEDGGWIMAFDTHGCDADKLPAQSFDVTAVHGWLKLCGWDLYDGLLMIDDVTDDIEYMTSGYDITGEFPVMHVKGTSLVFDTHGGDSELNKYSGTPCTIVRKLTEDEADLCEIGHMYVVRLEGGKEVHAFEDELVLV